MAAVRRLGLLDAMFLGLESRESMMHVGGLHIFSPPKDAKPDFLREVVGEFWSSKSIRPPWNLKLRFPDFLSHPRQAFVEDPDVDLDYHVRRSALPAPGDERELGILVSRLHSHQMDFHRPLWELHMIEGLSNGRFALYFKVHHSLMDGYTGTRTLMHSLSVDPEDHTPPFFSRPPIGPSHDGGGGAPSLAALMEAVRDQLGAAKTAGRALVHAVRGDELVRPFQAPKSILNRRISRNRRFATALYSVERLKSLARAVQGTLNDVVLALSAASLRRLLLELNALPAEPLIAMVPVNIRPKDDPGGGNAVGAILVSLSTDVEDPRERIASIIASSTSAKAELQGMSKSAILQYSALLLAPVGLELVTRAFGRVRPAFNLVISNVPGPDRALYFRGARLEASYPLSIPFHGYGLNITTFSYAGTLGFGFIGCRETVPHLQRLAVYSTEALEELERAVGR